MGRKEIMAKLEEAKEKREALKSLINSGQHLGTFDLGQYSILDTEVRSLEKEICELDEIERNKGKSA